MPSSATAQSSLSPPSLRRELNASSISNHAGQQRAIFDILQTSLQTCRKSGLEAVNLGRRSRGQAGGRARRGRFFAGNGGNGFHCSMACTQRRAAAVSAMPGKWRRSSTAAASSPPRSQAWRTAATTSSLTTNMAGVSHGSDGGPPSPCAERRRPAAGQGSCSSLGPPDPFLTPRMRETSPCRSPPARHHPPPSPRGSGSPPAA